MELEPERTFDPDALREASAESSSHLLRTKLTDSLDPTVDIKLGNLVDDKVKKSLADLNTLGAFGGRSVIDFAGPMLNEGSEGVNVLEILEGPPELKDIIAQHHEFYLQQEAELKLKREEWVNQKLLEEYFGDMGHNGWMPDMTPAERADLIAELRANPAFAGLIADLETKVLNEKGLGRGYYEQIKAMTDAQKERLHLEMFPPPPPPQPDGGFFGSIFGMIVLAIVTIVVSVFTAGAAIGFMAGGWAGAMAGGAAAFSGGLAAAAGAGAAVGTGLGIGAAAAAGVAAAAAGVTIATSLGVSAAGAIMAGMAAAAVGGFASGLVTGSLRMIETGGKWFKQVVIPAGVSALAAAVTYGVGHGINWGSSSMGPTVPYFNQSVGEITIKPFLHGFVQGGFSELQGGDFKDGFVSGAVGSVAGSVSGALQNSLEIKSGLGRTMLSVALAGASGGGVNAATGGDFWESFTIASSVALFNDAFGHHIIGQAITKYQTDPEVIAYLNSLDARYTSEAYQKLGIDPTHGGRSLNGVSTTKYNAAVTSLSEEMFGLVPDKLNLEQTRQLVGRVDEITNFAGEFDTGKPWFAQIRSYNQGVFDEIKMADRAAQEIDKGLKAAGSSSTYKDLKYDQATKRLFDPSTGVQFETKYDSKLSATQIAMFEGKAKNPLFNLAVEHGGKIAKGASIMGIVASGAGIANTMAESPNYTLALEAALRGDKQGWEHAMFDLSVDLSIDVNHVGPSLAWEAYKEYFMK